MLTFTLISAMNNVELAEFADCAVRERLSPPGKYLRQRYGKEGGYWILLLKFRNLLSGFIDCVMLRKAQRR